jgi:hypothetical protein
MFNPNNYETPDDKAEKMARLVHPTDELILEPCAGTGQIVKFLPPDRTIANEIERDRWEKGKDNAPCKTWINSDFLTTSWSAEFDLIISNVPFEFALQFIERSLHLLNPKNPNARIIFLLPIDWMGAKGRAAHWRSLDAHISHVYVLEGRTDYLMDGVPCSQLPKRDKKTGEIILKNGKPQMMGSRQLSDAVWEIRAGKGGIVNYL